MTRSKTGQTHRPKLARIYKIGKRSDKKRKSRDMDEWQWPKSTVDVDMAALGYYIAQHADPTMANCDQGTAILSAIQAGLKYQATISGVYFLALNGYPAEAGAAWNEFRLADEAIRQFETDNKNAHNRDAGNRARIETAQMRNDSIQRELEKLRARQVRLSDTSCAEKIKSRLKLKQTVGTIRKILASLKKK